MKQFLACLLVFALASASLEAQLQPNQKHIESIKKKVANAVDNQRTVTIQTYDGRRLQGAIGEAGPDSFVLSFQQQDTTLAYSEVKKIKWHSELSRQSKGAVAAVVITGGLLALILLVAAARD